MNPSATGFRVLASYPNSGITWLRLALQSLDRGGAPPDFRTRLDFAPRLGDRNALDQLLEVDSADLSDDEIDRLRPLYLALEARGPAAPQVVRTHEAWTRSKSGEPSFPQDLIPAAIYMVRDPRDVAVSLSRHLALDLDDTIAFMGRRTARLTSLRSAGPQLAQRLLTWSEHVRSWLDAPVRPLLVRYEDMLADPGAQVSRCAHHFGWAVGSDVVEAAVAATRFEVLQAAEERHDFLERPRTQARFFRRGMAGGWRDTLTPTQSAALETAHRDVMAEVGYL